MSYWLVEQNGSAKIVKSATKPVGEKLGPFATPDDIVTAIKGKSFFEQLGASKSTNKLIGELSLAGTGGALLAGGGAGLSLDAAAADTAAADTATAGAGGGATGALASKLASQSASTLLKDATLGGILGGLLTWGPLRMLELVLGVALIFMGIKTLTGIGGPGPI